MYMFFWFFKQLYYCLRRIFKSGLLLLILFFIAFLFIFVKPCFASEVELPDFSNLLSSNDNYFVAWSPNSQRYSLFIYNGDILYTGNYEYNNVGSIDNISNYNYDVNKTSVLYTGGSTYKMYYLSNNQWNSYSGYPRPIQHASFSWSFDILSNIVYLNFNMRNSSVVFGNSNIVKSENPYYGFPIITNNSSEIVDFSFDFLDINAYNLPFSDYYELEYTYPDNNTKISFNIDNYKSITNNNLTFAIPRSIILEGIVVRNGSRITYDLVRFHREEPSVSKYQYSMGGYTLVLTTEQEQQINENSNKQVLSDISNNQKETTQAVQNLENTITNSNIDDNSVYLPSDSSNDITQDGLNSIFTSIYNAFCTGTPQDIVFPIPFTNKNITLQPNYVRNMLTSSGANWVITIIEAFWWYLISRFIIKDITNKITKIKSGNIEDIENSNIKGDML